MIFSGIRRPTLFLICGLPGSGKTTLAKRLEQERQAVRLTPDEWLWALFGDDRERADVNRPKIERLQWEVAARALAEGADVVLDWGFWSRAERDDYRRRASAHGARAEVRFLDATDKELSERLKGRAGEPGVFRFATDEFAWWSKTFERPAPDEISPAGD